MTMQTDFDVIVAGGGPAGSTAAGYLSQMGYSVLVLEKARFPRHQIGESLLPSMMPILDDLGLAETIAAQNFPKKTGGTFIWGKSKEPWSVLFSTNPFLPHSHAYHVDRAKFDQLLLNNSERLGAEVHEGEGVDTPIIEDGRVVGVTTKTDDGGHHTYRAKMVIDASGRASVIGRQVTKRTFDPKMKQVAFWAYYDDVVGPEDESISGHVIVESHRRGWAWYIPIESDDLGEVSVGVISGQEFKDEYSAMGPEAFFESCLEDMPMMQKMLGKKARRVCDVDTITDWAYTCDRMAGEGFMLAGDAACFLDPLLSTGVSMAMLAGYSAAVTVNTIFKVPEMESDALAFYDSNYQRMWDMTRDFLHYFYAGNATAYPEDIFWRARGQLKLGDNVGARQAFCFLVNTIPGNPHPALRKQIHMFTQFMDNMEHPVEGFADDDTLQSMAEDKKDDYVDAAEITDDVVPRINGQIESSLQIDGEDQLLKPIRGVTYDSDRPIFSNSASWLLGRNIHELPEETLETMQYFNGTDTWGEIVAKYASDHTLSVVDADEALRVCAESLGAEQLVLFRRASADGLQTEAA
jgi:halogenation protein CepH